MTAAETGCRIHSQQPPGGGCCAMDQLLQAVDVAEDSACMLQIHLSLRGETHAARRAVYQSHAHARLHRCQMLADRRRRNAQFTSSPGQAASGCKCGEKAKIGWLDAAATHDVLSLIQVNNGLTLTTLHRGVQFLQCRYQRSEQGQFMKTYRIATIPGDGIGKEVVPAAQRVLETLASSGSSFRFEFENFVWGSDWFREHGMMMPDNGLDALRGKDAILFGSAGDPHIPDHITLWGLRLKICQGFDQYANVRPTRILPGIDS